MNSKEVQLSLSFCGALAAILLISAPVNEMTSLVGSGVALFISSGFFYGGISKYFADKENQTELSREIIKAIGSLNNSLGDSIQRPIAEAQTATNAQLKEVVKAIGSLHDSLGDSIQRPIAEAQTATNAQLKEVVEAIESLDDVLNDSIANPLNEASENLSTLSEAVNLIKANAQTTESNTGKLKELLKTAKDTLDELEDLSKNISDVSKVNETLQELIQTMNSQKEFYQTTLSQYKDMTVKDVELIENLARKLR